eukprot:TRINITY_DN1242_c0_g1_i1.p1 TRINITY_DN1242_c0_g1~~TRINITY_DN1242_c0_g1_i1.p1  ORF type:complete len:200 (+),score=48.64 TRINITY_DN1242_c0_g1_i1:114-713(+)
MQDDMQTKEEPKSSLLIRIRPDFWYNFSSRNAHLQKIESLQRSVVTPNRLRQELNSEIEKIREQQQADNYLLQQWQQEEKKPDKPEPLTLTQLLKSNKPIGELVKLISKKTFKREPQENLKPVFIYNIEKLNQVSSVYLVPMHNILPLKYSYWKNQAPVAFNGPSEVQLKKMTLKTISSEYFELIGAPTPVKLNKEGAS